MAFTVVQRVGLTAFWASMGFLVLYAIGGWGGPFHGLWKAATFMFPDTRVVGDLKFRSCH